MGIYSIECKLLFFGIMFLWIAISMIFAYFIDKKEFKKGGK